METMSRAGSSLVHSSLATLFAVRSRLKKNLMENLSRTTHWLRHHDRLRPSGRWRGTESVIGELERQAMAIVCLVSPSFGSSCCLLRQVIWFLDEKVLKRSLALEASCVALYMGHVMSSCLFLWEHFAWFLVC